MKELLRLHLREVGQSGTFCSAAVAGGDWPVVAVVLLGVLLVVLLGVMFNS